MDDTNAYFKYNITTGNYDIVSTNLFRIYKDVNYTNLALEIDGPNDTTYITTKKVGICNIGTYVPPGCLYINAFDLSANFYPALILDQTGTTNVLFICNGKSNFTGPIIANNIILT